MPRTEAGRQRNGRTSPKFSTIVVFCILRSRGAHLQNLLPLFLWFVLDRLLPTTVPELSCCSCCLRSREQSAGYGARYSNFPFLSNNTMEDEGDRSTIPFSLMREPTREVLPKTVRTCADESINTRLGP